MHLFGELLPTTPAPDFDLELSLETVGRLRELDAETLCYGHFGARDDPDDALAAYTDLLPEWVADVEAAAAAYDDRDELVAHLSNEWSSPTIERDVVGVLQTL
jgi:glyoxylase-like metal-dependent hydrolase (beta-lactamase superfamily II)